LFASHPPSQERVNANVATLATLPAGGELGVEPYKEALERTEEVLPAYQAYDEGRKALAEKNAELALAKAEEAIAILPQEGHFYALRGDARLINEQYDMAVTNFDSAIDRRDDFFYYWLQRGRAHERLGNEDSAVRDLQKSLEYLPTAPAHFTLGNLAAKRGDRAAAIQHYQVVAGGQGEIAEAARASLVRLDLGQNPGAYLLTRCDPAANGELVVSIKNNTSVPVADVRLSVQVRDSAGVPRRMDRRLTGTIAGGEVVSVPTGLGPYIAGSACPVEITGARVAR
jgi:tetratricopeptide (TPR) repeat protein